MSLLPRAFLVLGLLACKGPGAPADARPTPEPPPREPDGVLGTVHFARPRASSEALSQRTELSVPVDLTLAAVLGVDVAVLGAVETERPVDLAVVGPVDRRGVLLSMTPGSAARARSALGARYRFVHAPGLGERLEPRGDPGLSGGRTRASCALVSTPGAISARVVCASDDDLLTRAGRWLAFHAAARAQDPRDLSGELREGALGALLVPSLRDLWARLRRELLASATSARREHGRPPELGDPEAAVQVLGELVDALAESANDVSTVTFSLTLGEADLVVELVPHLRAEGRSALVADALARAGAPEGHPMASLLPADAPLVFASRGAPERARASAATLIDALLRVLGARVPDPVAARRDLLALTADAGDDLAVGIAQDVPDGYEFTLALALQRPEVTARAVSALGLAPWLRGVRVGPSPVVSPLPGGGVKILWPQAPRPPGAPPPAGSAQALVLAVRNGALVAVLGRHATDSLAASGLRQRTGAGAPIPTPSLALALDTGRHRTTVTYGVSREGGSLRGTLRVTAPDAALRALNAALTAGLRDDAPFLR